MADTDDLGLYTQWREGKDREAFDELVNRHAPMVYSVCRRILNVQGEAEETAIEAFQMLAYAPSGPKAHLATWLHAAATARARQRTRTQRQRPQDESKGPGDSAVVWEALQTDIDAAMTAVPWQARVPLIGQYVEDKTQAEIAKEIGLDRQRVITDGVTGLETLRKELAARGIEITSSRLKEMLSTQMVEPVPSGLAPRLSERAIADPLAGRRLAAG
ncbi:MAG TPA: sigma-70 family RNA polymerase sigma factor, partial [Candidatus Hydrogenedentes bacterium]|nr:sigma-70 family RNA polymerase sigma factor [Candidatus Hydrogenedentota bacterium]